MRTGKIMLILLASLALHSCFKKDEMITPHERGDVRSDTIPMTENYLYQVFYSLDSGKIVSKNIKTTYDIGFESSPGGWHIILNSSNFMKAIDLGTVTFGQPYDTTGMKMKFDKSDGNPDSTAIGQWFTVNGPDTVSNNHIYAINRGLDELGNPMGLYQVIFDSLKRSTYYFRYAPLNGGAGSSASVTKNANFNYACFSLKTGSEFPVEPPKQQYDLEFTQYTTLLYTDQHVPYPYLVTGVLLNRNQVAAAVDSLDDFNSITHDRALTLNYTTALDVIGYDWKYYNFTTGIYTIRTNLNYVVRTGSGSYFKLRFTGFYNNQGLKGFPVIEYERL